MDVRRTLRDDGAVLHSFMTVQDINIFWFEGIIDAQMTIISRCATVLVYVEDLKRKPQLLKKQPRIWVD